MKKTFSHNDRNFTAETIQLLGGEPTECLKITSAPSGGAGYVGPVPELARRDPDSKRIFTFTVNPDQPTPIAALTSDEAVRQCCDAIIEKETQQEAAVKGVSQMKEWLNQEN